MVSRFHAFGEVFSRLPAAIRGTIVIAATILIAATDQLTPSYVSFTGYYLIPLFLSIWYFTGLEVFVLVLAISLASRLYITEMVVPVDRPFWESAVSYGSVVLAFGVFTVIVTMLKKYVHQVLEYSDKDALTGLKSRRSFFSLGEYELNRRNRAHYPLSVVMVDIDCFKTLNDTQGHDVGDRLLLEFSQCLMGSLRQVDIIARLGGDEFALILPNASYEHTKTLLGRLHSKLQPVLQSFDCAGLGCSIGAVNVTPEAPAVELNDLLKRADERMYQVKKSTKNNWLVDQI